MTSTREDRGTADTDLSCAVWRKSTYSGGNGSCVEVASNLTGIVAVRDSKNPAGPALVFDAPEWSAFVAGIRAGNWAPNRAGSPK